MTFIGSLRGSHRGHSSYWTLDFAIRRPEPVEAAPPATFPSAPSAGHTSMGPLLFLSPAASHQPRCPGGRPEAADQTASVPPLVFSISMSKMEQTFLIFYSTLSKCDSKT